MIWRHGSTGRALFALALVLAWGAAGLEGKWTPQQVLELDPAWLKKQGLKLPLSKLWDAKKGGGILANAVKLSGCSASFVSESGLVVTNHHCVANILQQHSTPEANLFEEGYLARTREQEKPGKAVRLEVPRRFTDVTEQVLAAIPPNADDLQRHRAIEKKQKELVAECEKKPATRCSFAAFDGGLFYVLTESFEIADVRLVYAPPRMVGEYGGETDNWTWPRHSGDFALVRAYVAPDGSSAGYDARNVPYRPEYYFPISSEGVRPGDFVAVLGYPGVSFRSLLAEEMAEREALYFPSLEGLYGEWLDLIERSTAGAPEGKIALADVAKALANRRKNAQGQLAGLRRGRIVEKQRAAEEEVVRWADRRPEHAQAVRARSELLAIAEERKKTWHRDFLLDMATNGSRALLLAVTIARRSVEAQKPDAEREPAFQEREVPRLFEQLEREQKRIWPKADQALFASWVRRALKLPADQRIAAVDARFGKVKDIDAAVAELYAQTKLLDPPQRRKMFDESPAQLGARLDPLVDFGLALDAERLALKERRDRWSGAVSRLRPAWRKAVMAHAGKPLAPDANGTLRVSFAHVQGYSPRDAVQLTAQTTLKGMLEKHTGEPPFQVPEKILRIASAGGAGRWKDARLQDVPVCFLADADTTGGNSGSPVIDGQGRLVGVNFDRVWENVANDFGFNPDVARNISVDIRYMLWMLDHVEDATELLAELRVPRSAPGQARR